MNFLQPLTDCTSKALTQQSRFDAALVCLDEAAWGSTRKLPKELCLGQDGFTRILRKTLNANIVVLWILLSSTEKAHDTTCKLLCFMSRKI